MFFKQEFCDNIASINKLVKQKKNNKARPFHEFQMTMVRCEKKNKNN